MDDKLEKYRAKIRRKELFNKIKQRLISMVTFAPETIHKKDETIEIPDVSETSLNVSCKLQPSTDISYKFYFIPKENPEKLAELTGSENDEVSSYVSSDDDVEESREVQSAEGSKLKYITYVVWFCFWLTCWLIAIEFKFGIVFLLFSALFGIYFNTRTGPRRKGEVSAYSVFNENCESIKGTLTAEQLQREMMYGPLAAVH